MLPDIDEIAERYLEVYETLQRPYRHEQAVEVSQVIHQFYGWDAIVERFWEPFLGKLEHECNGRRAVQQAE